MNCQTFLDLLDQGGPSFLAPEEVRAFQEHLRDCPACARAAQDQELLRQRLAAVQPGPASIDRVKRAVREALPAAPAANVPPGPATGPLAPTIEAAPAGFPWLWVVLEGVVAIGILVWLVTRAMSPGSAPPPPPVAPVSTREAAPILASGYFGLLPPPGKNLSVTVRDHPLQPHERVFLSRGQSCALRFPEGQTAAWEGTGNFSAAGDAIDVAEGELRFRSVGPASRSLQIRTPVVILRVTDAALDLRVTSTETFVQVAFGTIVWAHRFDDPARGTMTSGGSLAWNRQGPLPTRPAPTTGQPGSPSPTGSGDSLATGARETNPVAPSSSGSGHPDDSGHPASPGDLADPTPSGAGAGTAAAALDAPSTNASWQRSLDDGL